MIMDRIEDFAQALPATGALIGLDLGTKTIGVAISDGLRSVATPVETIKRAKFNLDRQQLEAHMARDSLPLPLLARHSSKFSTSRPSWTASLGELRCEKV